MQHLPDKLVTSIKFIIDVKNRKSNSNFFVVQNDGMLKVTNATHYLITKTDLPIGQYKVYGKNVEKVSDIIEYPEIPAMDLMVIGSVNLKSLISCIKKASKCCTKPPSYSNYVSVMLLFNKTMMVTSSVMGEVALIQEIQFIEKHCNEEKRVFVSEPNKLVALLQGMDSDKITIKTTDKTDEESLNYIVFEGVNTKIICTLNNRTFGVFPEYEFDEQFNISGKIFKNSLKELKSYLELNNKYVFFMFDKEKGFLNLTVNRPNEIKKTWTIPVSKDTVIEKHYLGYYMALATGDNNKVFDHIDFKYIDIILQGLDSDRDFKLQINNEIWHLY